MSGPRRCHQLRARRDSHRPPEPFLSSWDTPIKLTAFSGQCGFNQAASHQADPIKRHRARRERSHPKVMLPTKTIAVAPDLLENTIGPIKKITHYVLLLRSS